MKKRNFILLIIILLFLTLGIILYFYARSLRNNENGTGFSGENFFSQFNPFSRSPKPIPVEKPIDVSGLEPTPEIPQNGWTLKKISSESIAGYGVFLKERLREVLEPPSTEDESDVIPVSPEGTDLEIEILNETALSTTEFVDALRYIAKATGNIYQTFIDKIEERKFLENVVPKLYDAYFGNKSEYLAGRKLKEGSYTIETLTAILPKENLGGDEIKINELKGGILPDDTLDISLSPDKSSIFYLFRNKNTVVGVVLNLLDGKKIQVFDSQFSEWLSSWGDNQTIFLATKPSSQVFGYVYKLDIKTKILTKVFGEINGLVALGSPNGKNILYSDNFLNLRLYDLTTGEDKVLGLKTLAEKCVFGATGEFVYCAVPSEIDEGLYPDFWYSGEISFQDEFWQVNVLSGETTFLINPSEEIEGEDIDGIKLSLDSKEDYLFFVNKKDAFLWGLRIK